MNFRLDSGLDHPLYVLGPPSRGEERSMSNGKMPFEVRVIWRGLQLLTILTFGAFLIWALQHLARMFS
jgi:hypothetical protein